MRGFIVPRRYGVAAYLETEWDAREQQLDGVPVRRIGGYSDETEGGEVVSTADENARYALSAAGAGEIVAY